MGRVGRGVGGSSLAALWTHWGGGAEAVAEVVSEVEGGGDRLRGSKPDSPAAALTWGLLRTDTRAQESGEAVHVGCFASARMLQHR